MSMNFFFNWKIKALQGCVGFCCTEMWLSHKFTCSPSLFSLPSHPHPAPWGHHKGLSWAPCAIQWLPTSYLFYTWWSVYEKTNIPDTWERFVGKFSVIIQSTRIQCFSSVQFSRSVMSNSLQPHGLQHTRLPCPSSTPRAYSNSCPSHRWCHSTISSSVNPLSSRLQSFPASGSFPMSELFTSGGQSIRVSASAPVLPKNIQGWFPLGWTVQCLYCFMSLQ